MAEVLLNNPPGVQLTTPISNADTTVHVSQALGSGGQTFRLRLGGLGGELMLVTGGAGTTSLNVSRGSEGTTPTAYGVGTLVEIAASAGALNAVIAESVPTTLPPNGPAGGDLGSTYPNPQVVATHLASPLPTAQGGTGNSSGTAVPSGAAGGDLGSTYPNPTVVATHLASPLPVAQGGTGDATLVAHEVLLGNGTSAVTQVSGTGTSGQVLTSNGAAADPTWQNAGGGSSVIPNAFTPRAVQIGGDITTAATPTNYAELAAATGGPGTGGLDLTIAAATNDVLEIVGNITYGSTLTNAINVDLATIVSSAAVNWLGQSGGTTNHKGVSTVISGPITIAFSIPYTVQAGDISGGNVVLRPFYADVGGSNLIGRSLTVGIMAFSVKNLKH